MEYLSGVWAAIAPAVGDHLWQSTMFAAVAAIMTLALRKNQARVRYRLWVAASVKFLIPFSLLISLGGHLARPRNSASVQSDFYAVTKEIGQPFTGITAPSVVPIARTASADLRPLFQEALAAVWLCGFVAVLSLWWWRRRRFSRAMRGAVTITRGREVDALRRLEQIAIGKLMAGGRVRRCGFPPYEWRSITAPASFVWKHCERLLPTLQPTQSNLRNDNRRLKKESCRLPSNSEPLYLVTR